MRHKISRLPFPNERMRRFAASSVMFNVGREREDGGGGGGEGGGGRGY